MYTREMALRRYLKMSLGYLLFPCMAQIIFRTERKFQIWIFHCLMAQAMKNILIC